MAFTDEQQQALKAKLRYRHVRTRASHGTSISYVEGWHTIAEANRIFGYDSWDRQTISPRCVWRETQRGETTCFYSTKVRITVRAGESVIVREGVGTGTGRSASPETAHEIGLKAAETDADETGIGDLWQPVRACALRQRAKGSDKASEDCLSARARGAANNSGVSPPPWQRPYRSAPRPCDVRCIGSTSNRSPCLSRGGCHLLGSKSRQLRSSAARQRQSGRRQSGSGADHRSSAKAAVGCPRAGEQSQRRRHQQGT